MEPRIRANIYQILNIVHFSSWGEELDYIAGPEMLYLKFSVIAISSIKLLLIITAYYTTPSYMRYSENLHTYLIKNLDRRPPNPNQINTV